MVAYHTELMNSCHSSQSYMITHRNVSSKRATIAKNTTISNHTIVSYVTICHDPTVFTYNSFSSVYGSSVDSNKFSNCGSVTYFNCNVFVFKFKVLWNSRDYSAWKNIAIFANARAFHYGYITTNPCSFSYHNIIMYSCEWFNYNILGYFCARMDVSKWLVHFFLLFFIMKLCTDPLFIK